MSTYNFIAISQRVDREVARLENRDALDQRLTCWVTAFGGMPLPVPNTLGENIVDWLKVVRPSAVLLSGGNDIGDSLERDRTELLLLRYAEQTKLPVLGICRGMQMLAQYAGAKLVPVKGHTATYHVLKGKDVAYGTLPSEVNSFHSWGLACCPPNYITIATALDESIEAICHRDLPWEGWMWHPEREVNFGEIELARARKLLTIRR